MKETTQPQKPSERIAQIAEERYCRCASDAQLQQGISRVYDSADPRAIVDYLDEQHAKLSELRRDTKMAIEEARSGDPVMVVLEGWLCQLDEFLGTDAPPADDAI